MQPSRPSLVRTAQGSELLLKVGLSRRAQPPQKGQQAAWGSAASSRVPMCTQSAHAQAQPTPTCQPALDMQRCAGMWQGYSPPPSATAKLQDAFDGTVREVVSGDCLVVADSGANGEPPPDAQPGSCIRTAGTRASHRAQWLCLAREMSLPALRMVRCGQQHHSVLP